MKKIITSIVLAVGIMPAAFAMEHNNNQISNNNSEEKTDTRFRNLFYELPPEVVANITEQSKEDLPRTSQQLLANVTAQRLGKDKLHLGNSAIEQLALELKRRIDENPRIIIDRGIDALLKDVLKSNVDNKELLNELAEEFELNLLDKQLFNYQNTQLIDSDVCYRLPKDVQATSVAFSGDQIIAVSPNGNAYVVSPNGAIKEKHCLKKGKMAIIDQAGRFFAMTYPCTELSTYGLLVYDLKEDIEHVLVGCNSELSGINFSAEGNYIAGIADKKVFIWECETGKIIKTFDCGDSRAQFVAINDHNGQVLIIAYYQENTMCLVASLYDVRTEGYILQTNAREKMISMGSSSRGYIFLFDSGRSCFLRFDRLLVSPPLEIAHHAEDELLATCIGQPYYALYNSAKNMLDIKLAATDIKLEGSLPIESADQIVFNTEGTRIACLAQEKCNDAEKHMIIMSWQLPEFINNDMTLRQMLFVYAMDQYFKGLIVAKNSDAYPSYKISSPDIKQLLNSAAFKEFSLQDRKILADYLKNCKFPSKYLKKFKWTLKSKVGSELRASAITYVMIYASIFAPIYSYLLINPNINTKQFASYGIILWSLCENITPRLNKYLWNS